jgi:hypothetical protein
MRTLLRTIERQIACQRAQVILTPIAEAFAQRWEVALASGTPIPTDLDILFESTSHGVAPLAPNPVLHYLGRCRRDNLAPDPQRIVLAIVHGYAETHITTTGKTCRCLARIPLVPLTNNG